MCGIVGALTFSTDRFRVTEQYITGMRDQMVHRGPDSAGTWTSEDGRIGLGHRRLSIIDLSSKASQPMSNEDDSLWISFNGEIYNHAEIRAELMALGGHVWKTDHSDTEVLLHAFEEWGIDCLHRFRGMFAFALWDNRKKELWLVRDRIGIKPLYYSTHNGRITFASEIKALLEDPGQERAVNEQAFYHYLSFLTTPAPDTLFKGIRKLPGGTCIKVSIDGAMTERRYWDAFDNVTPLTGISEAEINERLMAELRTAVQLRKESDVPVGVFLSGGVDSSTNAALFSESGSSAVNTFSIGYDADYASYPSELPFARDMAQRVGANHHELLLGVDDLIDFLPKMVELQDEPIADPVCVPVYFVSKLAKDNGVTVCQVGEGADELFCGYYSWEIALLRQSMDRIPGPRFIKQLAMAGLRGVGAERTYYHEWIRRSADKEPQFWGGAESFYEAHKKLLLSPRLKQEFKDYSSWDALSPIRKRFEENAWETSALNWMSYLDLNMRLPELLLMRVDKMSMGSSLESRVPFLDHKVVELALGIPASVRYRRGEPKRILKEAVRGLIPDSIIDRKKQGFGVPVYEWFSDRLGGEMNATLRRFCKETDFLDPIEIEHLIAAKKGNQLWFLFNFALWWERYIK
jgi:asparagine synthase (glutamine-hydrolysing)